MILLSDFGLAWVKVSFYEIAEGFFACALLTAVFGFRPGHPKFLDRKFSVPLPLKALALAGFVAGLAVFLWLVYVNLTYPSALFYSTIAWVQTAWRRLLHGLADSSAFQGFGLFAFSGLMLSALCVFALRLQTGILNASKFVLTRLLAPATVANSLLVLAFDTIDMVDHVTNFVFPVVGTLYGGFNSFQIPVGLFSNWFVLPVAAYIALYPSASSIRRGLRRAFGRPVSTLILAFSAHRSTSRASVGVQGQSKWLELLKATQLSEQS